MDRFYKTVRVITVAPVLAVVMLLVVSIYDKDVFPSVWHMMYSLFFLGLLPLSAYPLQKYIPGYRDRKREGQRSLAIIFAFAGFTLGCLISFAFPSSRGLQMIFLEYFWGALMILLFNKVFHIKISGHACGALAPVALFLYFGLYAAAVAGMALTVLVFVASIKTKRHTVYQLIGGGLVPLAGIIVIGTLWHI